MRRAADASPNEALLAARGSRTRERVVEDLRRLAVDQGDSTGINENALYRYEQLGVRPRPHTRRLLCEYYDMSPVELGFEPMPTVSPAPTPPATLDGARHRPDSPPATAPGAGGGLVPLREVAAVLRASGVDPMHRRTALRVLGTLTVAGSTAALDPEPWERLARALDRPARIDPAVVKELAASTVSFYRLEEHLPARRLYRSLSTHLNNVSKLLTAAPAGSSLRRQLAITAGEAAALAGWVAWDLQDGHTADRLYAVALNAANEADDSPLAACILSYQSYAAAAAGDPAGARRLLQAGQERIARTDVPVTRAWLAAREAEEAGALGDHIGVLTAIDRAHSAYDPAGAADERAWTAFFVPARLGAMEVAAHIRRGEPGAAETTATRVLAELDPDERKTRSIILADVAVAHAQQGHLEPACQLARDALELSLGTETSVGLQHLGALRGYLEPWRTTRPARELYEQLAVLNA